MVGPGFNSLNTQKHTRTLTGKPIFIFSLSPVNYTSETPQNSFLQTMKSFRVKSSENKSKTCENHVFSHVFTCTSLLFFDQKFKYRGPPPTYAHILLTTPQKHLRLTSQQLWKHSEPNQARTSRKTANITFFTCFSRFAAIYSQHRLLIKSRRNFRT